MGNYKEKYEQALNRAKVINPKTADYEVAVKIFPELIESEDEKIKKTISDILLIDSDEIREILDANNVLMQDIDTWLEKQGEIINEYEDKLDRCACESFDKGYKAALEKQGEQKSAEWSLEDELNFNQAIYVCHQYEYFGVEFWLKSLKQRMKGE